jgi:DNA-binding CsgD family transcriptional regulator
MAGGQVGDSERRRRSGESLARGPPVAHVGAPSWRPITGVYGGAVGMSLLADRGVTRKEAEVLHALAERLTNAEIAARLYVSERTVESHVSSLLRKLQAGNRRELAQAAQSLDSLGRAGAPVLPAALELLAESGLLVGRHPERQRLAELWEQATVGRTLVAVVCGEAGIGKSRLVAELATDVHRGGGSVLLGSCFEDAQAPYQPFVQAVTEDLTDLTDSEGRRRAGIDGRALERLLPDLATKLGVGRTAEAVDLPAEPSELLTGLSSYLRRAAAAVPVMLVLEDLHWATGTTLDTVRHLARSGGRAALLVVATFRNTPPDLSDDLSRFLADLARYPSVHRVELSGLGEQEVGALVASLATASDRRADLDPGMIQAETGGNPLLVRELVTAPTTAPGRRAGSLPGLLSRRYERLSGDDIALLDLATVLGPEFDAELVATASDTGLAQVLDTLEHAEAAGLVAAMPGRPGRFTFVHALFRSVRYDALPTSRRLRLHQRVARALEPHADNERVLPELARHACIAAPLGDARTAIDYSRRAGDLARRILASEEAAGHYRQALEIAELLDPPDPQLRLCLRIDLGSALLHSGHADGRTMMLTAADEARAQHQPGALAAIAMHFHPAGVTATFGGYVDQEIVAVFQDALDALPPEPSATRARLLAGLASELQASDLDHSRALARDAITIARSLDDWITLGRVLIPYRQLLHEPVYAAERRAVSQELIELGRRVNEPIFTLAGFWHLSLLAREDGDLVRSEELFAKADALFGDRPPPYARLFRVTYQATREYLAGDLVGAEATATDLLAVAPAARYDIVNFYSPLLFIRLQQGRIAEVVPRLERMVRSQPHHRGYAAALAAALARVGRRGDAATLLADLAGQDYDLPHNFNWLTGTIELADAVELLDDRPGAAILHKRLEPFAGRLADHIVGVSWPVDHALAQLALTLHDPHGAAAAAARALEASRRRGTPSFLARELILLATARTRARAPQREIAPLIAEALRLAAATGAHLIRQEAERYGLASTP